MDAVQGYGPLVTDVRRIAEQFRVHMNAGATEQLARGVEISDAMVNHCVCRECRWFVKHHNYGLAYECACDLEQERLDRTKAAETNLSAFLDKLMSEMTTPAGTRAFAFNMSNGKLTPVAPVEDVCACGEVHK